MLASTSYNSTYNARRSLCELCKLVLNLRPACSCKPLFIPFVITEATTNNVDAYFNSFFITQALIG